MSKERRADDAETGNDSFVETVHQLEGLQHGIAGLLMPLSDGHWRVHYYSSPTFDKKPGTDFATFDEAIAAIEEVLEFVNTPEERERARLELRDYLRKVSERETEKQRKRREGSYPTPPSRPNVPNNSDLQSSTDNRDDE